MPQLNPEAKMSEIALRWPRTVPVFSRYGLDLCCGGGHSLNMAAQKHRLDIEQLIKELTEAIEPQATVK